MTQMTKPLNALTDEDRDTLMWATGHLEHPSLAARLSSVIGTPIDIAFKLMPRPLYLRARGAADDAVGKLFRVAVSSLRHDERIAAQDRLYHALAAGTGAIGGFFGVYGLPMDLAVSTTLMLRSIAEIARAEGEHVNTIETRLACLEVFALGGHSESDDAAETGYYSMRLALAWPVTAAARHVAQQGATADGPMVAKLISLIGARFGVAVSQKTAAQLVPLVGAVTGSAINIVFMSHYQEMARGHFVVRRLERKYGPELVKNAYEDICRKERRRS